MILQKYFSISGPLINLFLFILYYFEWIPQEVSPLRTGSNIAQGEDLSVNSYGRI